MVDRKTRSFATDRRSRRAPDRSSSEDREEILREQQSDGFATELIEVVRRAIGAEIQNHEEAGRKLPVARQEEEKARTSTERRR